MSTEKNRILIIEDDRRLREVLKKILDRKGFQAEMAADGAEGIIKIKRSSFEIALTDLKMPGMDGMEVLKTIRSISPSTYVIVMTAYGTIDSAVEAMKSGAFHYVTKPFKTDEILIVMKRALEHRDLQRRVKDLTQRAEKEHRFEGMVGKSKPMRQVFEMIRRVSKVDSTVLITGKTGTGKELVARAIHQGSKRKDKPFVVVNSSAIPETLLESELFGHVKGAFTGALRDKQGLFQKAHLGTLFLDEIGEVSFFTQVKLLRAIEDKTITPVGSTMGEKVDLRLLVATNHDLQEEVLAGSFRNDLYYRLNVVSIHLPDLRERKEDIPLLADHFLKKYRSSLKSEVNTISKEALIVLLDYDWPGHVRELEHAIERAVLVCDSEEIRPEHLPLAVQLAEHAHTQRIHEEGKSLQAVEKEYIKLVLKRSGGHKSKAASTLGIDRRTLYRKLKSYGIL
ncbi:MAG: sigma-54 dependent transcriptional regulator [Candidatus Zixiibacteriota bacterium]